MLTNFTRLKLSHSITYCEAMSILSKYLFTLLEILDKSVKGNLTKSSSKVRCDIGGSRCIKID